jgi:hypothetical protein
VKSRLLAIRDFWSWRRILTRREKRFVTVANASVMLLVMKRMLLLVTFAGWLLAHSAAEESDAVVIHEWGTFTALQDDSGYAVPGINTDDEPVPNFVHDIAGFLMIRPTEAPQSFFKAVPSCHSDVTMRLETPVLYVHAPKAFRSLMDVKVEFRGGWLTQFFPNAEADADGIKDGVFGHLREGTVSRLCWTGLQTAKKADGPDTHARVWLAPRRVDARTLTAASGESEKFLFYRGVGHLDAPLRVTRDDTAGILEIAPRDGEETSLKALKRLWLVDIRSDGSAAFRFLTAPEGRVVKTSAVFEEAGYSTRTTVALRDSMRKELMGEGLFADEAEALLNTWESAYFKSAGLRVFFFVPREWTDGVLPLTVSGSPSITRVMVGRIELITPAQRALLAKIAAGPAPDSPLDLHQKVVDATVRAGKMREWLRFMDGKLSFRDIGVQPPPIYRAYLDLGRFRNALVLEEERRRPTPELQKFISDFRLSGYLPR